MIVYHMYLETVQMFNVPLSVQTTTSSQTSTNANQEQLKM